VFYQAFKHLTAQIQEVEIEFKRTNGNGFNLDEIKGELFGIVEDILQNMQPPSAVDHVFGAIAQIIQFKAMKMMDVEPSTLLEQSEDV